MHLPKDFITQMNDLIGREECDKLIEALDSTPPTSIRLNPTKPYETIPQGTAVPCCSNASYLSERPTFTFDPLFHAGTYYVQEASSMFVDYILRKWIRSIDCTQDDKINNKDNKKGLTVLDLCAAPGGKSTLTLSALPEGSVLIANEIVRQRANILAENIIKWGAPNTIVTNNCASDFQALGEVFDLIICDAPCSGEGMFRKDPQSIDEWSISNVEMCRERQREILTDIWECLQPNGLLIYSTCTYNTQENEENVAWAAETLNAEIVDLKVSKEWNITGNLMKDKTFSAFHFFPHRTTGEGFFTAVLRKHTEEMVNSHPTKEKKIDRRQSIGKEHPFPREVKAWVSTDKELSFSSTDTTLSAFPYQHTGLLSQALTHLKVIHHGITLATMKGKAIIPAHSLAMSTALNRSAFPTAELSEEEAIAYLRTESITLPPNVPKGFVLLTFHDQPLGFVKNLGTRANNLYPSEWRIRKNLLTPNS